MQEQPTQPETQAHRRVTPPAARGGPLMWLMGGALAVCLVLVIGLIGLIVVRGSQTFWPKAIERVEMVAIEGGEPEVLLGRLMEIDTYRPDRDERARIEALNAQGLLPQSVDPDEPLERILLQVGNREFGAAAFRWVPLYEIDSRSRPENTVVLERLEWGPFIGSVDAIVFDRWLPEGEELFDGRPASTDIGEGVASREVRLVDGERRVLERVTVPLAGEDGFRAFEREVRAAKDRRRAIERLERGERSEVDRRIGALNMRLRRAEMEREETLSDDRSMPFWLWGGTTIASVGLLLAGVRLRRSTTDPDHPGRVKPGGLLASLMIGVSLAGLFFGAVDHPWSGPSMSEERLTSIRAEHAREVERLAERGDEIDRKLSELRRDDARFRVVVTDARTGRFAPEEVGRPDEPMRLSQIDRAVRPNALDFGGRLGVYFDRWAQFLTDRPRPDGEGGLLSVIVGTVTLTMLLTITVVPLGVIAAIYLREYAHQGFITSVLRIAVNNLAGVPSIVYGVFGLGFFCYIVGGYIDTGPDAPAARTPWWTLVGALVLAACLAITLMGAGRRIPGRPSTRAASACRIGAGLLWVAAVAMVFYLVAATPYFGGFFRAEVAAGQPVFGARGILWASLTLSLLTLPVVIVATEEAIAAVPRSIREASLGCGASKWQTIRRVVLPGALPGIMTGAILAIARGAGEVAPLMLVGAVKLAPQLPVSTEFPFIHGERSFMHLGFHIYDLGFQSRDSEAAQPLVWTTTLLLIAIVLLLNLAAIVLRSRLRSQKGPAV